MVDATSIYRQILFFLVFGPDGCLPQKRSYHDIIPVNLIQILFSNRKCLFLFFQKTQQPYVETATWKLKTSKKTTKNQKKKKGRKYIDLKSHQKIIKAFSKRITSWAPTKHHQWPHDLSLNCEKNNRFSVKFPCHLPQFQLLFPRMVFFPKESEFFIMP